MFFEISLDFYNIFVLTLSAPLEYIINQNLDILILLHLEEISEIIRFRIF